MSRILAASCLAALTLLGGCASDGGSDQPAPAPARETGSPIAAATKYDAYVALGDSYTAAPLVPPTDTSTVCLRSGVNYPALLADAMPGTALTDVSCSGASTNDMTAAQVGRLGTVPPQFDALKPTTDLVTIGLGGNDEGLFATTLGTCTQLAPNDPTGSPCGDAAEQHPGSVEATLQHIRANLAGVVEGVRRRSPEARIIVVGYPQIIPASGTCDLLPLATGDYPVVRAVTQGLDEAVRLAAQDAGAEFVDLWDPSEGHDICSTDPWINGRVTSADKALAYHPLAVEQQAVADLLLTQVQ